MKAPEFRMKCSALGLSVNNLAEIFEVNKRTVRRWVSNPLTPVPDYAATEIDRRWNAAVEYAQRALSKIKYYEENSGERIERVSFEPFLAPSGRESAKMLPGDPEGVNQIALAAFFLECSGYSVDPPSFRITPEDRKAGDE